MNETAKQPNIKMACHAQNRLSDLQNLSQGLEKCQKSLNDYLDSKRNAFPRFFFISDDELLSILGSRDPECVQEHMIKVGHVIVHEFMESCVTSNSYMVQQKAWWDFCLLSAHWHTNWIMIYVRKC